MYSCVTSMCLEKVLSQRLVFWNSIHLEVASDSFCFLINSSWLLVFILFFVKSGLVFSFTCLQLRSRCRVGKWRQAVSVQISNQHIFVSWILVLIFTSHSGRPDGWPLLPSRVNIGELVSRPVISGKTDPVRPGPLDPRDLELTL